MMGAPTRLAKPMEMTMTAKTKKSTAAQTDAVKETFAKADAWLKDGGEKLRDAAVKATEDLQAAGTVAIEGEIQHSQKLFKLMGDMFNARTAATLSVLRTHNLQDALKIEQDFARDAVEALNTGVRELGEIRYNVAREAAEPFTARAREVADSLKGEQAA